MYGQERYSPWHECNTLRISRSVPASDAGKRVRGLSYSGSSPKATVPPLSWWTNDAGWLAGVHGCTSAKRAWRWQSSGVHSDVPFPAQPELPLSNAG